MWSLLGTFDWIHLLTREAGDYEPGVFDLRGVPEGEPPRATGLARLARELATNGDSAHPALAVPGWWARGTRFDHPPVRACQELGAAVREVVAAEEAPLLVVGETAGALAEGFREACGVRGIPCVFAEEGKAWAVVRVDGDTARRGDGGAFTHGLPAGHRHYVWACLDELFDDGDAGSEVDGDLRAPLGARSA